MKFPAQILGSCAILLSLSATVEAIGPALVVSVQNTAITGPTTSFDVLVTNTSGSPVSVLDVVTRVFEHSANPDVVFGVPTPTFDITPIHASGFQAFNGNPANNSASDVSSNYAGDTDTIAPGATLGLMSVPVTVLHGYNGSVLVDFNTDENVGTFLTDPTTFEGIPYTPVSGTLTIGTGVPEPASLAILGLAGMCLFARRRQAR